MKRVHAFRCRCAVARDAWFRASASTDQQSALDALGMLGGASEDPTASFAAVSTLIELANVTLHPREKVPVLRALARCSDRPFAVPVLLGHLEHPDPQVVAAALDAVGHIGAPFGGSSVLRWLRGPRREPLAESVLASALLALARTGHPETGDEVVRCWEQGLVDGVTAHLALAEAVSPRLLDEAIAHLDDPVLAGSAVLHLASVRHPALPRLFAPLLSGADGALALQAHALLEGAAGSLIDHVLRAAAQAQPVRRRRLSRGLRAWSEEEVASTWQEAVGLEEDTVLLTVALQTGLPSLQDLALRHGEHDGPVLLRHVLRQVHTATPLVHARLDAWIRHADRRVATDAVRVHLNLFGPEGLPAIAWLRDSDREEHRVEWVRAWQNGWRAQRDGRRLPLEHGARQDLVRSLRTLIRRDASPRVRIMALYCVGHLGLRELGDELVRVVETPGDEPARRAAAIALAEVPGPGLVSNLTAVLATARDPVLVHRLVRALLACVALEEGPQPDVASTVLTRLPRAPPEAASPMLALLGRCGSDQGFPALQQATGSESHRQVCVALTALGALGSERGLGALLDASSHPDPERRLRAVEALARLDGAVPADRLADVAQDPTEELDVRTAALSGLLPRAGELQDGALRLPETGDPLAAPLLVLLREASASSEGLDSDELDRRLEQAVPGFSARALDRQSPDALQALRTAEFLHSAVRLPSGLDQAPPVILWVKGLEVWLNAVLRKHLASLASPGLRTALTELGHRWPDLRTRLAPTWRDDLLPGNRGDLWRNLARDSASQAPLGFSRAQLGLRSLATCLLACAAPPQATGLATWSVAQSRDRVVELANGLVCLANQRNPLTHRVAAGREVMGPVRELALGCARGIVRLG